MPTISYMLCVLVKNFELVFEEDQKEPVIFKNRSSVCYRQQRSCGKVMFLHVSVILFRGGSGRQSSPPAGRHLYGRQTPPPGTTTAADGTLPTGMDFCYKMVFTDLESTCIKISNIKSRQ